MELFLIEYYNQGFPKATFAFQDPNERTEKTSFTLYGVEKQIFYLPTFSEGIFKSVNSLIDLIQPMYFIGKIKKTKIHKLDTIVIILNDFEKNYFGNYGDLTKVIENYRIWYNFYLELTDFHNPPLHFFSKKLTHSDPVVRGIAKKVVSRLKNPQPFTIDKSDIDIIARFCKQGVIEDSYYENLGRPLS